jgi:hypothetical protein
MEFYYFSKLFCYIMKFTIKVKAGMKIDRIQQKGENLLPTDMRIPSSHFTTSSSCLACFWETSAKVFSALIALAFDALAALSAEALAASAFLRAWEVALSLASKEATRTRALARETTDTTTT